MPTRSLETWSNALDFYGHESPADTLSSFYASLHSLVMSGESVYFRSFVESHEAEGIQLFIETASEADFQNFAEQVVDSARDSQVRFQDLYHFNEVIVLAALMSQYPEVMVAGKARWQKLKRVLLRFSESLYQEVAR